MSNLFEQTYNPDALSRLANLSNDEVFMSPEVANPGLWQEGPDYFMWFLEQVDKGASD